MSELRTRTRPASGASTNSLNVASETAVRNFVSSIGQRVRRARRSKEMSRRELSDITGISQRYLAQLEAGEGNISVALLFRVATALEASPDWFLRIEPTDDEEQRLLKLFRGANPQRKLEAEAILRSGSTGNLKHERICLIGLRGAGKSTLGELAAKELSYEFIELNDAIERQCGMEVSEIMALYGQEGYRNLEREAIESIVESRPRVILAAAGGIVSEPETFDRLLGSFHSVWLKAAPEEHMQRVREQGDNRPMAGNPRAMDDLKSILKNRERHYARADHLVDTTGRSLNESLHELVSVMRTIEAAGKA